LGLVRRDASALDGDAVRGRVLLCAVSGDAPKLIVREQDLLAIWRSETPASNTAPIAAR
jgi:hypothetical protein